MRNSFQMRVFFLFLILLPLSGYAQPSQLRDSLAAAFDQPPRFVIRLETRNSFVTGRPVHVRGVKAGYQFGDKVTMGFGYHWLDRTIREPIEVNTQDGVQTIHAKVKFDYVAPFFEYSFYQKQHWYISIPVQIGFGRSSLHYEVDGEKKQTRFGSMLLYEPAMSVEYRFLRYFGVGAGVGFRLVLVGNRDIDANFNSPTYALRIRILLGKLYRDTIGKDE